MLYYRFCILQQIQKKNWQLNEIIHFLVWCHPKIAIIAQAWRLWSVTGKDTSAGRGARRGKQTVGCSLLDLWWLFVYLNSSAVIHCTFFHLLENWHLTCLHQLLWVGGGSNMYLSLRDVISPVCPASAPGQPPPSLNAVSNNSTTGRLSWTTQGPMDKNNSPHLATVFIFASTTLKTVH